MSPIMACAVLLTGASSLRVAPSMVLQPRRDLLAGGAAAAASSLLVPEAIAKKPLCLPGTNSAKALGGPGYTIGILEHDTPSFKAWHKVLEGFGDDLLSAYPPECKVIDEFFIKTTAGKPSGQDAVLAGLVFETSGLKAVKKFLGEGKSPIFEQGRRDGWLTGKWRENYFASAAASESRHHDTSAPSQVLRLPGTDARPAPTVPEGLGHQRARGVRPAPSTPPTRRLAGFGGHGLGVPYKDWLKLFGSPDIDALHDSLNILYSVCGPVNGKVSTDLTGGGVGVLHVHKSYKDALRFDATFQDIKEKVKADGILKEPSRFVYGEVMNTSDDFILKGSVADTTKA